MEPKILGVGPRTASFLRTKYPKNRAKLIARDFNVSKGTAERWLRGEAPTVAHIEQMTIMFGEPYIRMVFAEAFERQDLRIRNLEAMTKSGFAIPGVDDMMAGVSLLRSMADRGVTALRDLADWASNLIKLSPNVRDSESNSIPNRVLLIERLIETVPSSPSASLGDTDETIR